MSDPLQISLPAGLVDQIAARVAQLIQQTSPTEPAGSPWLDVDGAAAYLGLSRDAVYKLSAARAIPVRKKQGGQGLRFHRVELDEWMLTQYPRLDRSSGIGGAGVW